MYYNQLGYTGGLREKKIFVMILKNSVEMVERAVKGMLPHNRLGRQMAKSYLFMQVMLMNNKLKNQKA